MLREDADSTLRTMRLLVGSLVALGVSRIDGCDCGMREVSSPSSKSLPLFVGVEALSPPVLDRDEEKRDPDLSFQELNFVDEDLRVIFWIKDSRVPVPGVAASDGVPETLRSRDSWESVREVEAMEAEVVIERPSLDLRGSAGCGEGSSAIDSSKGPSFAPSKSLALPLSLPLSLVKRVRKLGAAGLSLGVLGLCEDCGRVPMGA